MINSKITFHGVTLRQTTGRIRLHYEGIRYLKDYYKEIGKKLCAMAHIDSVTFNAVTENLLVYYRHNKRVADRLQETIDSVLEPYAMQAYKAIKEENARQSATETEQPGADSKSILKRLAVSGTTVALGNTLLRNYAKTELLKVPYLGKFTTFPAIVSLGLTVPLFQSAWKGLVRDKKLNADFLTVTSIVASILLGQSFSALTIIMLSDVAEFMTTYTIERTRKSIKKLLSVEDAYAWKMLESGELEHCPIEDIIIGDTVVIHTGEKVTVDGEVLTGQALVDQSSTTGEFLPVVCKEGDKIFAGSIIKSGVVTVRALKVGDDTVVSRIINMVENVASQKAPIQHYADQFSNYLVPLNFLAAIAVYAVTRRPDQALKMLVIDYSCGIKLSTAAAFSAAINAAVRRGILIKGGAFLERMSDANTIIFDKTGTITEGKPEVVAAKILTKEYTEREVVALACAAEETSSHPLAGAILDYGTRMGVEIPVHSDTVTVISKGSSTMVDGKCIRAGSLAYMRENKIRMPRSAQMPAEVGIATYIAADHTLLSVLCAMDKPRTNIRRAVNNLRNKGIDEISLLTGDSKEQAGAVASQIGADSYQAELLPEQKAEAVLKLQADGNRVVMVGDGINDAPALSYADVGISLGSKSTDVAMETSDIVIGRNDPMLIPQVRDISSKTMEIVKQNFGMVIGINTLGLILGAASNISVFWSAMLHNMSTIAVVGNSCRLLFYDKEREKDL